MFIKLHPWIKGETDKSQKRPYEASYRNFWADKVLSLHKFKRFFVLEVIVCQGPNLLSPIIFSN